MISYFVNNPGNVARNNFAFLIRVISGYILKLKDVLKSAFPVLQNQNLLITHPNFQWLLPSNLLQRNQFPEVDSF